MCVSGGKKCSFFRKFDVLFFLKHSLWDSPFFLITDEQIKDVIIDFNNSNNNNKNIFLIYTYIITIFQLFNVFNEINQIILTSISFNLTARFWTHVFLRPNMRVVLYMGRIIFEILMVFDGIFNINYKEIFLLSIFFLFIVLNSFKDVVVLYSDNKFAQRNATL